uniref:Uncharacterized protein n=1 Tax=Cucumis melo TaxID=3656 RepID=A0A9I9EAJ8_CUCME
SGVAKAIKSEYYASHISPLSSPPLNLRPSELRRTTHRPQVVAIKFPPPWLPYLHGCFDSFFEYSITLKASQVAHDQNFLRSGL